MSPPEHKVIIIVVVITDNIDTFYTGIVFLIGIVLYCSESLHIGLLSPSQVHTAQVISPSFYSGRNLRPGKSWLLA